MENELKQKNDLLYYSFNQDNKCFIIGTKDKCSIYKSNPFKKGFDLSKNKII